jgi:HEAT repeat protein
LEAAIARAPVSIAELLRDTRTREDGMRRLARSRHPSATPIATSFLDDPDSFVRMEALECLKVAGGRRHTPLALSALNDRDFLVRVTALECLAEWRAAEAAPRVVRTLADRAPLVRAYAAWTLAKIRAREAESAVRDRLAVERNGTARAGLLEFLATVIRDREALRCLLRLLQHRDYRVRCFTSNSLVGAATRRNVDSIRFAMREALRQETTVAAAECLRRNLRILPASVGGRAARSRTRSD